MNIVDWTNLIKRNKPLPSFVGKHYYDLPARHMRSIYKKPKKGDILVILEFDSLDITNDIRYICTGRSKICLQVNQYKVMSAETTVGSWEFISEYSQCRIESHYWINVCF